MAELRLSPLPRKVGLTGFAGLLGIIALMLVLPSLLVHANMTKPETRKLVIELDRELFGKALTEQEAADERAMKAEANRILAAASGQGDSAPTLTDAQQTLAEALNERMDAGQGALWVATLLLMACFFLIVSLRITGKPFGLLVNERNLMDLSRFQTVLWTIVLLSAYYTAASLRIYGLPDSEEALNVALDWHLWALMGISFTSLVATPLIHMNKQAKTIADDEAAKLQPAAVAGSDGILNVRPNFEGASWTDLFKGDELKDAAYVDIAKLQMFFFTLVAALSYGALLLHMFGSRAPGAITEFPAVSEGLLALLGISHAGYLTSKSIDRTKSV
ncbi:hypothetical protein SAMN02799624_04151 [Paenibacillus sp. UNC496MF]|uniref:hypothetical protein n=1 Tax=Paenibacillus sp. UNC496MF TaxID=1502753 RepID=UPI0008E41382|nr:hypothetical protein [Paenibacillus sp. UNC496MF]SFJ34021.1 hypothetical protein SAMN02799624_04151 [Paenibacillus sp. UNC496MF]